MYENTSHENSATYFLLHKTKTDLLLLFPLTAFSIGRSPSFWLGNNKVIFRRHSASNLRLLNPIVYIQTLSCLAALIKNTIVDASWNNYYPLLIAQSSLPQKTRRLTPTFYPKVLCSFLRGGLFSRLAGPLLLSTVSIISQRKG